MGTNNTNTERMIDTDRVCQAIDIKGIEINSTLEAERYFKLKEGIKLRDQERARRAGATHRVLPKLRALADRVRVWINAQPYDASHKTDIHIAQVHLMGIEHAIQTMIDQPLHPVSHQSMLDWNRLYKLYQSSELYSI